MTTRHLLKVADLSKAELEDLMVQAAQWKKEPQGGALTGKTMKF